MATMDNRTLPCCGLWVVRGLLVAYTCLLLGIAWRHAPVVCEVTQIPAGVSHLELGCFDLYKVHPPLVRMWAALPITLCGGNRDWSRVSLDPLARCEMPVGQDFFAVNKQRWPWLLFLARTMVIPLSVLGAAVTGRWAHDLYGRRAGILAVALWCLNPSLLAHGSLVTADVAAASATVVVCYQFAKWIEQPQWMATLGLGMALGVAQLTKTTLLILLPALALTVLILILVLRTAWKNALCYAVRGFTAMAIGLLVLNVGYAFEGTGMHVRQFAFKSQAGIWLREVCQAIPCAYVPLPRNYVQGIDLQKYDFEMQKRSFLRGEWRDGGWSYFYGVAALVKEPIGLWILLGWGGIQTVRRAYHGGLPRLLPLVVPAVALAIFVSLHTGFSIHYRYIFPVLPLAIIAASGCMQRSSPARTIGATLLVGWIAGSSLWVYPHSLAYFNESVGGPRGGPGQMVGSAISWGQDLTYLRRWLQTHPAEPLYCATLSYFDPRLAGIEFQPAPPLGRGIALRPGLYVIDVNFLRGTWEPAANGRGGELPPTIEGTGYAGYQELEEIASVGYSMKVYRFNPGRGQTEPLPMRPCEDSENPNSSITSLSLLQQAMANEPEGWHALVDKYSVHVYRWCRHAGLSDHDARDVSQEVFAAVARNFSSFQHHETQGGFKNWLYTVTKNKLIDYWRWHAQREQAPGGTSWYSALKNVSSPSESPSVSLGQRSRALELAIQQTQSVCSERDWNIFSAMVMDGRCAGEVAREFSVPNNVVYIVKSRVLKQIRTACQNVPPEDV